MFDLAEGKKVILGAMTTGGSVAAGSLDWVNMENMHYIYVLAQFDGSSGPVLHTQVAEDFAGTSSSSETAATKVWTNYNSTTLDRFLQSTALFLTMADAAKGVGIMRFDPASVSASSNTHFGVYASSYIGVLSVTYIAEPRYAEYPHAIATTSST
jgi:hypothetical protein